uniref:xylanase n=1 Tax=uncultured organism TaxID=155900 RepID=UPI00236741A2|nr:Chain A, xylanase [uncultured organism]8HKG_B Chain B, xylanase [uncultured organism]
QGLKDIYKDYFLIGVAVNQRNVSNAEQAALVKQEFNSITCENDMKPEPTEPQEGKFNWEAADRIANFCRTNGIKLRGHCLMWHSQIGRWMYSDNPTKEVFFQRMKNHIQAVVSRYKDVVYAWDVVNEAMTDDPKAEDPFRQSPLYKIAGDEFIAKAFQYAREADPNALLFYNDYNECDPVKSQRIYEMVKRMKENGVPIDGIGMQGHYNIYGPTEAEIDAAITKYKSIVKHIHVTELDIRVNAEMGGQLQFSREGVAVSDSVKQHLADQYARVFNVLRKHRDVIDCVTFWNLSDRDSWLGQNNYPLPFDANYKPKMAYDYIKQMKAPAWPIPEKPKPNPNQQRQRRRGGFGGPQRPPFNPALAFAEQPGVKEDFVPSELNQPG